MAIHAGAEAGAAVQDAALSFFPPGARVQVISRTGPPHSALVVYPAADHALPVVFPLGVIIATARFVRAVQVVRSDRLARHGDGENDLVVAVGRSADRRWRSYIVDDFGDFGPGRWLWEFDSWAAVRPFVPARGRQKLWNWNPEEGNGNRL